MEINKSIIQNLEGVERKYLVKIEADNNSQNFTGFYYNPYTNEKNIIEESFVKFVYLRNFDSLSNYIQTQIKNIYSEINDLKNKSESIVLENLKKIEDVKNHSKELSSKQKTFEKKSKEWLEIEQLKTINTETRESLNSFNEKYEDKLKNLQIKAATLNNAYKEAKDLIPSIKEIKARVDLHNKNCNKYEKIKFEELFVHTDTMGKKFQRLENGYKYMLTTTKSINHLTRFLTSNFEIFKSEKLVRELSLMIKPKPYENVLIDKQLRMYKGIQEYDHLHKLSFDIETTAKYPAYSECNNCHKRTAIFNENESPNKCQTCGHTSHTITDDGQIYMIAIADNKGFKICLNAFNDKTIYNQETKKFTIDFETEKSMLMEFFKIYVKLKPNIIGGYNTENFDFNYILYRTKKLGINFEAVKCPKCDNGYMKPTTDGFSCSNEDECGVEITYDELKIVENENCNKCKCGTIKKGKTKYGCSNHTKCQNRIDIEKLHLFENCRENLLNYVQSSYHYRKPIHKNQFKSTLKVGSEIREYYKTVIYGCDVVDRYFMVLRAKAINSAIKKASLKYIAKNHGLKDNPKRFYVLGDKLFDIFMENKNYILTENSIYKEIPLEYQNNPNEYLNLVNNPKNLKNLADYYDKFYGVIKESKNEIEYVDEIDEKEIVESENYYGQKISTQDDIDALNDENSDFGYILCRKFYEENSGKFTLITGQKIIENYAMDDVLDDMKVDNHYLVESFLNNKIHSTSFENFCYLGTASAWNLLSLAYLYNKKEAVPHRTSRDLAVGGLAKTLVTGFSKNIQKLDFSSLYPSIQLALDVFPNFAKHYLKDMLLYLYNCRFYWKDRRYVPNKDKFLGFLTEDNNNVLREKIQNLSEDSKEYKELKSKYENGAGNNEKAVKVRINSLFGSLGSEIFFGADMDSACMITSSGRQFLRSAIWLAQKLGCVVLVCDTDGYNISIPEKTYFKFSDNGYLIKLTEPINFEDLEYKGKKGVSAMLKYYNEQFLPKTTDFMKLSDDGVWLNCLNIASKNYINQEMDGKIKMTGNIFKSSTLSKFVVDMYNEVLSEILKSESMKPLYDRYISLTKNILTKNMPLIDIVKVRNIKQTMDEYLTRPTTKSGARPKMAFMELMLQSGKKVVLDEKVAYINNGKSKADGDGDMIVEEHLVEAHNFKCKKCNVIHKETENLKPSICESKILVEENKLFEDNFEKFDKIFEFGMFGKVYQKETVVRHKNKLFKFNDDFDASKIKKPEDCLLFGHEEIKPKKYSKNNSDINVGDIVYWQKDLYICKVEIPKDEICDSTEFDKIEILVCLNPRCNKKHFQKMDMCDNCDSDEFENEKIIKKVERPCSYLVDYEELEKNPNKKGDYNVALYVSILNDKMKPLLVCFKPNIREHILVNSLEEIMENKFSDKDFEMVREQRDSMSDLMTMTDAEIDFWNRTKQNPLEIFGNVQINKPLHCDKFNIFFESLAMKKFKENKIVLRRSQRFTKPNGYFLKENDTHYLYCKNIDNTNFQVLESYEKNPIKY